MSFIPQACPACSSGSGDCCEVTFTGFCLSDGTPIGIVIQEDEQVGWFNLLTGVFTPGPPPAGTSLCDKPLDCATDSITVCQGTDPWIVQGLDPIARDLSCELDSVTICPPVSGTFEVTIVDQPISVTGTVNIQESFGLSTATLSNVAASISSVTLLAANSNRRSAIIYNDSAAIVFVKFGVGASSSSFTTRIPTQSSFEIITPAYTGIVTGVWEAATGSARMTEMTV